MVSKIKKYKFFYYILNFKENVINLIRRLNNNVFATCSLDKTIKIWNVENLKNIFTLKSHNHYVSSVIVLD